MSQGNLSPNIRTTPLRVEAQPTTWKSLTDQQQEALEKLLGMLNTAVDKLAKGAGSSATNEPAWLMNESHSQVSFIDGKRGSGKTTLMLTLTRMLVDGDIKPGGEETEDSKLTNVKRLAASLKNCVIVVEPIDMEPLPLDTPILAAILARVDHAVQAKCRRHGNVHRDILADDFGDDREAIEFQQVMSRVARSLDSNLQERRGSLDRQQFGQNVKEQEEDRCQLRSDLNKVFQHLSRQLGEANGNREGNSPFLFLVPFDDVDLNPRRCLELFRIIRTYAPPQLFFLPMGQLELVQKIFQIATAHEFEKSANVREQLLRLNAVEMGGKLEEIAYANLRKMIPEAMRISLQPVSIASVLNFRPLGAEKSDPTLGDLLKEITFDGRSLIVILRNEWDRTEDHSGYDIDEVGSAGDFKFGQYPGLGAFEVSARRLVDLWTMLFATIATERSRILETFLKDVVREDSEIGPSQISGPEAVEVSQLSSLDQQRFTTVISLDSRPLAVTMSSDLDERIHQTEYTPSLCIVRPGIAGSGVPTFRIKKSNTEQSHDNSKLMIKDFRNPRTRCALVLWHDLQFYARNKDKSEHLEYVNLSSLAPVATRWSKDSIVPWQLPPLGSFYQFANWSRRIVSILNQPLVATQLLKNWAVIGKECLEDEQSPKVSLRRVNEKLSLEDAVVFKDVNSPSLKEWSLRLTANLSPEIIGYTVELNGIRFSKLIRENRSDLVRLRAGQLRCLSNDSELQRKLNATGLIRVPDSAMVHESNELQRIENRLQSQADALDRLERLILGSQMQSEQSTKISSLKASISSGMSLIATHKEMARSSLLQSELELTNLIKSGPLRYPNMFDVIEVLSSLIVAFELLRGSATSRDLVELFIEQVTNALDLYDDSTGRIERSVRQCAQAFRFNKASTSSMDELLSFLRRKARPVSQTETKAKAGVKRQSRKTTSKKPVNKKVPKRK